MCMTRNTIGNLAKFSLKTAEEENAESEAARIYIFYFVLVWRQSDTPAGNCVLGQHQASQAGSISACVLNGFLLLDSQPS